MNLQRRAEIAANLAHVRDLIGDACTKHGRDIDEVTLIAVTKTFPVEDVLHLAALGITDVGENKDQEARSKHQQYHQIKDAPPLRWHLIGQLQRNKAKSVVTYADMIHSLDRIALADALEKAATELARQVPVLIQVDLENQTHEQRGGVHPDELLPLAHHVMQCSALDLQGLMAVAPLGQPPAQAFEQLAHIRQDFLSQFPHATMLSAGMSHDLEEAIAHGATHVRIGSALLGTRPTLG